ncbi:hypothetical protein [Sphaerisporangium sp. TRM90804]|uniref:5'-methylthioadenosine/S-adenosylhomocysteine nucleosidase family protein n=1 Tax=Sphaerisporangium sp. TRM90804 TaxID=3031113 RepID=UPI00244ADE2A|nr:hypothetical protein [Sphaerisporangium sp. TRM90804]MDH2430325.1 hypothetical protein [Sphaerisporangium sp. TRM90804]
MDRARGGGVLISTLRLIDRRWELLMLAVPPGCMSLAALTLALSPLRAYPAAISLGVLAMVYVTTVMAGVVLRQGFSLVRSFLGRQSAEENAVGNLPFEHWWMPLCHQARPARVDGFPQQIRLRLSRLIRREVEDAAALRGGRADRAPVTEVLVCLLDGATSAEVREAIARSTEVPASERIALIASSPTPEKPRRRFTESGGFLLVYVAGMVAVVLAEAALVPGWERAACGAVACAGRPDDYMSAVRWLLQRLLLSDPEGLSPQSYQAWTLGWLTSLVGLLLVPVTALSIRQLVTAQRREKLERDRRHGVTSHTRVLIMVATRREVTAVIAAAAKDGEELQDWHMEHHTVHKLGILSSAEVYVHRCEQGALGPSAAMLTAQSLIEQIRPAYVILTGIAYGLKKGEQSPCDIMVATQVRIMDQKRVRDGEEFVTGDRGATSVTLRSRADATATSWTGPPVHFGPMLAMNTLVNDEELIAHLQRTNPDAIGGDMEAGGVYAAATKAGVDWIAIKAICDWGMKKTDKYQKDAAKSSAEFVIRMISRGGLDEPPR